MLTAVKKAEDDSALILRFYEWAGKATNVKLYVPAGTGVAYDTDLMERPIATLPLQDGAVNVQTKPYEIKTVKVRFASPSSPEAPPATQ